MILFIKKKTHEDVSFSSKIIDLRTKDKQPEPALLVLLFNSKLALWAVVTWWIQWNNTHSSNMADTCATDSERFFKAVLSTLNVSVINSTSQLCLCCDYSI